jgi:hypothetical protein
VTSVTTLVGESVFGVSELGASDFSAADSSLTTTGVSAFFADLLRQKTMPQSPQKAVSMNGRTLQLDKARRRLLV